MPTALLIEELPAAADPPGLFEKIRDLRLPFLLESSLRKGRMGRYSILGAEPFLTVSEKHGKIRITGENASAQEENEANPFDVLKELISSHRLLRTAPAPPFIGGAVGYFGYDLARRIERLPSLSSDDLGLPEIHLGFYDAAAVVDHFSHRVYLVAASLPERGSAGLRRAKEKLKRLRGALSGRLLSGTVRHEAAAGFEENPAVSGQRFSLLRVRDGFLTSTFSPLAFKAAVERVREYIAAGDIFVINLAQRFSLPFFGDPWVLYRSLRSISPAPFAAYLDCEDFTVISASPELFLRLRDGRVETRPIKGTRPRGDTPETDRRLREELWQSAKDRAELAMVVDMLRSDLGKVCLPGSIQVPELYRIEDYATVFQLVATVEGRLDSRCNAVDLLRACFPGGSVTGAPKVRSMQIIEELEPVRRGIYTGAIGYLGFDGNADMSIAIRSVVCHKNRAWFHAGGGITIDSDPEAEYRETLDKARALLKALGVNGLEVDGWRL